MDKNKRKTLKQIKEHQEEKEEWEKLFNHEHEYDKIGICYVCGKDRYQ